MHVEELNGLLARDVELDDLNGVIQIEPVVPERVLSWLWEPNTTVTAYRKAAQDALPAVHSTDPFSGALHGEGDVARLPRGHERVVGKSCLFGQPAKLVALEGAIGGEVHFLKHHKVDVGFFNKLSQRLEGTIDLHLAVARKVIDLPAVPIMYVPHEPALRRVAPLTVRCRHVGGTDQLVKIGVLSADIAAKTEDEYERWDAERTRRAQ